MPTTRRRTSRTGGRFRVTAAAVEAYRAGDRAELDRLLGIKPWQPSPLETDEPEPPEWADSTEWAKSWPEIYQLRLELEKANAH